MMAENLMVMARNLEACTGNDALMSESDVRRTSRTLPILLAGSDYVCSGFGSIQRYDNMFGPSQWNAEDFDDWLAMQRDWGVDGGLRTADPVEVGRLRRRAAEACRDVYRWLGLADFTDDHVELAIDAVGSKDLGDPDPLVVLSAAQTIRSSGLGSLEVARALLDCGYEEEAARLLAMLDARVQGDHLQTAAIFDEQMQVLSLVTDPNDYAGPGTGYEPSAARQAEIDGIRQARGVEDLRADQSEWASDQIKATGPAAPGSDPREVVIGLSPGVGRTVWRTLSGLSVVDVLRELLAGLEEEGCQARVVRVNSTLDLGMVGLTAARLAGSGIGIGLQGKGTALIHRRDLPPLANLELYSMAPVITPDLYRLLGANAGRHAKGATPVPARNPYTDEAIEARYHTSVISLVALERACVDRGARHRGHRGAAVTRAFSGSDSAGLTIDRLARDEIAPDDVRIHPDTLERQAESLREHGNPQLAENFRRAAEMALMSEAEVMALYDALRPHRSTAAELATVAAQLDRVPAPRCAALVREAADVYARRGLLR